jgi:hypothetical protein
MIQTTKFLLKLFIGIFIILLTLWNRFFRTRIGYDFESVVIVSNIRLFIISFFSVLFLILFTMAFLKTLSIEFKSQETFFFKVKKAIVNFFYETLEAAFNFFFYKIPDKILSGEFLTQLGYFFYINYYKKPKKLLILHAILVIIPRFIVCVSFFYSVIIKQNLSFFFSILILLALPLSLIILKYTFKSFVETNLKKLEQFLEISLTESGEYFILPKTTFYSEEQFQEYVNLWGELSCIQDFIFLYETITTEFFEKYQIVMYFLYACSWNYLLFIMLPKASFLI